MLEHIALDTNDLDSDTDTTEYRPYAVHEDFQSTVWGLSDTDGDILERYNYTDPYGVSDSEDVTFPRFDGHRVYAASAARDCFSNSAGLT